MKRCPACQSSRFWGCPVGYHIKDGKPVRCEVCTGWGITTDQRIFHWELSL